MDDSSLKRVFFFKNVTLVDVTLSSYIFLNEGKRGVKKREIIYTHTYTHTYTYMYIMFMFMFITLMGYL